MDDNKNKPRQGPKSSLQFADPADGAATSGQLGPKSKKPHKQFWDQSIQPAPANSPRPADEHGHIGGDKGGDPKPAKKPHSKFREYSEQAKPSERLQTGDIPVGDRKAAREHSRIEKSAFRAEKTGAKLETAIEKRNKKKPSKNPGVINSVRHAAQFEVYRQIHGKIHQSENENAGVEAAHRTELAGERVAGSTKRFIQRRNRTRPARNVRKWEKRNIKAKADLQFKKLTKDHPDFKKNAISRFMQKQRLKRRYQKQAREAAKKSAKAAKKTTELTGRAIAAVGRFVVSHPVISLIAVLLIVLIVMLHSCTSMVGLLGSGVGGTVEGVADQAETVYTQFETELQSTISNMETTRPGYDEYRYNTGTIGHNINEIMGFMMVYGGSPNDDIESVLRGVFDNHYTLTTREITEIRTRTRTVEAGEEIGQVRTTGYCACDICCGPYAGGPTASGVMPGAGHTIAVDANNPIVPMGTKIMIDGVTYTVEDTGNLARYNSDFDIFFDTHAEALAWGRQTRTAYMAEERSEVTEEYEYRILEINVTARPFAEAIAPYLTAEQLERYNRYDYSQ